VFVLAGSLGLTGAAYLTSQAALLSGSGLVTLGIPKSLNVIVAKKLIEVMTRPLPETKAKSLSKKSYVEINKFCQKIDVLALGPGLSQNKETQQLIRKVIASIDLPMVIDADGINALVGHLNMLGSQELILTPHPGEMARLIGKTVSFVRKNRKTLAKSFAKKYNVTLILKGHHTIVASPQGKTYLNRTGNAGMASGGVGDVLTGIVASFIGQGLTMFDSAKLGVHIHGLAGDIAARKKGKISLIASDLLHELPDILRKKEK